METDLCSRFLLPLLQALFNDETTHFQLNNENNIESRALTKTRPGGFVIQTNDGQKTTVGYLEAKPLCEGNNAEKLRIDLVRLGVFGKYSIDTNSSNSILLMQAVGPTVVFYLQQKRGEDVCLMLELCTIKFPMTIAETPTFFENELDILLNLLPVVDTTIRNKSVIDFESPVYPTITSPSLSSLSASSIYKRKLKFSER